MKFQKYTHGKLDSGICASEDRADMVYTVRITTLRDCAYCMATWPTKFKNKNLWQEWDSNPRPKTTEAGSFWIKETLTLRLRPLGHLAWTVNGRYEFNVYQNDKNRKHDAYLTLSLSKVPNWVWRNASKTIHVIPTMVLVLGYAWV